ncbi:aldose 1-epimerase [Caballeronia sp. TF1N1]|uniref:aldose 1-epimerase n=1 Tax=Caballeronia sp. TF1N1 TaxID=2878153 RepID=UPI001FD4C9C1|nr:aldose 1-epimerase [Caballeronia sp. TF1N1]
MNAALDSNARGNEALVELRHGARRVVLAPHIGGAIAAFFETRDDGVVHWLRPATPDALAARNPLGMGSFPLLPYCNRIRDARFAFDGVEIDLSGDGNGFAHALHGNAWRLPWQVSALSEAQATLSLRHEPSQEAAHHWPFAYEAEQRITLDAHALHVTITMRNLSPRAMPFGMGHHPYFPRTEATFVHANVDSMWHASPDPLPLHAGPHASVDALTSTQGMSANGFDLDNHFTGWKHTATIDWPNEGRSVTLNADAPLDFMVIYAPAVFPSLLCVEPVSNVADWVNLNVEPALKGGGVLQAGESITASFSLTTNVR